MRISAILIMIILGLETLNAQILNGSFEDWSGGEPVSWFTSNHPEFDPNSINVIKTTDAQDGIYAVRGEVVEVTGHSWYNPPSVHTFDYEDILGFPINSRPVNFRGYYIYEPVQAGEYLSIDVKLIKDLGNKDIQIVGTGGTAIANTIFLDSIYTEFVLPISYYSSEQPDYLYINISIGGSVAPGSVFYVDNLSLDFLQIISPALDDIVIAGEKDTIKWSGATGNINISYSFDDGSTYHSIANNYPAGSGKYVWEVPDGLLSTKALIKIEDSNAPNIKGLSRRFYIKPWQLTRIDANGDFELFEPDQDGWSFVNDNSPMWPQSWWQQFNYSGTDPFTGANYPGWYYFYWANSSDFPDWPLFVDAFGLLQCYNSPTFPPQANSYNFAAIATWSGIRSGWGGSCYGFAVTSLLYFYYKSYLLNIFPEIGDYQNLFSASINNSSRKAINQYFLHEYGNPYSDYDVLTSDSVDARQTLQEAKNMFSQNNIDAKPLGFYNQNGSGGHEVVAYKLERVGNTSKFNLRCYDSNNPGLNNRGIIIDSLTNIWTEATGLGWGNGTVGLVLGIESGYHLNTPALAKANRLSKKTADILTQSAALKLYNTSKADISIISQAGGTIGFSDSLIFNTILDGVPIIPKTGNYHPPIGYYLPEGEYSIQLSKFTDTTSYVFFLTDSTIYNYGRSDADVNESDNLKFAAGLGIENSDPTIKSLNLETIIEGNTSEKIFTVDNIRISQNDSIHIREKDRLQLFLNNYGVEKSYDLQIRNSSANGFSRFSHNGITLADNSTHQIVPVWDDLQNVPVIILSDLGNDGTIDDTLYLQNQATGIGVDHGLPLSPNSFNLAQNFPNPFNPTTTIQYTIPQRSNVVIRVYDIIGNEVANLINEVKDKGVYSVAFNAAQLASGIYFYTLRAGSFVQTKKMLLIK